MLETFGWIDDIVTYVTTDITDPWSTYITVQGYISGCGLYCSSISKLTKY